MQVASAYGNGVNMHIISSNRRDGRAGRASRRLRGPAALTCGIVLAGVATFAHVAGASAAPHTKTPLQQGLAYYKGKTITFIAGGAPGGSLDAVARLLQPYMAQYLGATINVVDVAISAAAQDEVAASPTNGLTIGLLNGVPDMIGIVTGVPIVNFNPTHVDIIGAPGANADMYIVKKSSSYQSFGALVNNSAPVQELALTSGYDTTVQLLTNAAFNIKAHIITGYANEASLVAGFNRGDGELMFGPLTSTAPLVAGGIANPIGISKQPASGSQYAAQTAPVQTLTQLAKKYPPKTKQEQLALAALEAFIPAGAQTVFAPTKTPTAEVDALIAAMKAATHSPAEIHQALLENLTPGWQPGPKMKQTFINMATYAKPIKSIFASI